MDTPRLLLSVAIAVSAALTIRAEYRGPRGQVYRFKPLTTALILALALAAPGPMMGRYRAALAIGLVFSLAGDVFLMLPADRFVAGLAGFLAAHLAYLVAFADHPAPPGVAWLFLVLYLAVAAVMLPLLWPRLGRFKVPVLLYMAALLGMAWQAAARAVALGQPAAWLAAVGAALFVVSDAALALNRFRAPWPAAQKVVLATYYAAQWLIALSISARGAAA
jgi:uncharacterized membrane protein YhhN